MYQFLQKINEGIEVFATNDSIGGDSLSEKLNQLMPSIYIMIATLGSLCFVFLILTFFLYKPVKKMVQKRKDFIQSNINESIQAKKKAFDLESEARVKLVESKSIGNEMITKARQEAEIIKNKYIEQGKLEVERLIKEANEDIEARKRILEQQSYNEVVSIAMNISEKIIKDKITEKDAKKYLDEYLRNK